MQEKRVTAEDLKELLFAVQANPTRYGIKACKLCARRPVRRLGIFVPTDPDFASRLGQPQGKTRIAPYGLCSACYHLPDRNERIEAKLLEDCWFFF